MYRKHIDIYIYIIIFLSLPIYIYVCIYISLVHDVYNMYFIILLRYLSIAYILCVLILFDRYWHCIVYTRHVDIMRKFIANIRVELLPEYKSLYTRCT